MIERIKDVFTYTFDNTITLFRREVTSTELSVRSGVCPSVR